MYSAASDILIKILTVYRPQNPSIINKVDSKSFISLVNTKEYIYIYMYISTITNDGKVIYESSYTLHIC